MNSVTLASERFIYEERRGEIKAVFDRFRGPRGFTCPAVQDVQQKRGVFIPFCLYQPFPNPFSSSATIRYSLPRATHVSLKVYDVSGRLVNRLVDDKVQPGVHQLVWTGEDDLRRRCASGVYFVRFEADQYQASKKMVLIK